MIKNGYTRVSQILDRLRDRGNINPQVLTAKAEVGTEVHRNIALAKSDGIPFFDEHPVINPYSGEILRFEKRGLGYYRSFAEWDKSTSPSYVHMEERYYDDNLMITGQIDALISLPYQDGVFLIDFKTSASADFEIWNMQAHFYWYLLKQNKVQVENTFVWIQLNKDGKSPRTYNFQFDENVMSRCIVEAEKYSEEIREGLILD